MICNHSKSNAKSLDSRRIDINSQLGSIIQIGPYEKHCAMKDMLELDGIGANSRHRLYPCD